MKPIVIMMSLPGYQYADPHMPSWLHFDPNNLLVSGQAPITSSAYNLTFIITGSDTFSNAMTTNFTLEVFPNLPCVAKYTMIN